MVANSILDDVKDTLDLAPEHTAFDTAIKLYINTALADAAQLGVGPAEGVEIKDSRTKWGDITDDDPLFNALKSYVHLRVKLLFDPPDIGFVLTAMKEQIEKAEWRLSVAVDNKNAADEEAAAEAAVDEETMAAATLLNEEPFRREFIYYGD